METVRAPLVNDLSCLMDSFALTNICGIIFNSLSSLLLFTFLQWLTNSLFSRVSSRTGTETAGAGNQVFGKQGYAGDARGSRCQWPGLLFSHTCKPELWDHLFFCLPIVIYPGGAFQELASHSLSPCTPLLQQNS